MKSKIKNFFKKNWPFLVIMVILFLILVFCHYNTFVGNDDLPYSFFKRLHKRVTNIFQIIWDNARYYKSTNGRFIVHCIVMFLLMFGKNLWAFFNPLIIVVMLYAIYKIATFNKKQSKKTDIVIALVSSVLFLSLYNFKELIYWVAGSVNYLWVCCFIFLYCLFYTFNCHEKYKKINYILLFVLSSLHECSFAFFILFYLAINIISYIKNRKLLYWKYIIPIALGGCFLLLAPGNINRASSNEVWNNMGIFSKIDTSLPYLSGFVFKMFSINQIIPTIYLVVLLIQILKSKIKLFYKIPLIILIVSMSILTYYNLFRYASALLAISCFTIELFIHILNKEEKIIPIQVGFWAACFSMIITSMYYSLRPNLLLYMYFILYVCKYLSTVKVKYINMMLLIIAFGYLSYNEVNIYYHIGTIHRERMEQIAEYKKDPEGILYLKTIPYPYTMYHVDCNAVDQDFWTYNWFIWYYDIPEGTIIEYK